MKDPTTVSVTIDSVSYIKSEKTGASCVRLEYTAKYVADLEDFDEIQDIGKLVTDAANNYRPVPKAIRKIPDENQAVKIGSAETLRVLKRSIEF
jgi:hypothetical protein